MRSGCLAEAFAHAAAAENPEARIRLGISGIVEGLASDPTMARVVLVEAVGASTRGSRTLAAPRGDGSPDCWPPSFVATPAGADRSAAEIDVIALATMAAVAESVADLVARGRADRWQELVEPLTASRCVR